MSLLGIETFNNDERILINNICKNENLLKLTKNDVKNSLIFSREIADKDDAMVIGLIDSLCETLTDMPEEEWNKLKMLTPFPVIEADLEDILA